MNAVAGRECRSVDPLDHLSVPFLSRGGENFLSQKLYVGNLPWATTGDDLKKMFAEVGEVEDAVIISYKDTGRSKGFGFVTMKDDAAADEAVKKYNGFEIEGRAILVDKARPMSTDGGER